MSDIDHSTGRPFGEPRKEPIKYGAFQKPTPVDLTDFLEPPKFKNGHDATYRDLWSNESMTAGFEKLAAQMMAGAVVESFVINSELTGSGYVKKTLEITFIEVEKP